MAIGLYELEPRDLVSIVALAVKFARMTEYRGDAPIEAESLRT
jgi:hypothetical protein